MDAVDELYRELAESGVLHYADTGSPVDTAWGTREFAVTDIDNNLVGFFQLLPE